MTSRYDAVAIREYTDKKTGEQKTQYTRIGVAFPFKEKDGYSIMLDALPVDGKVLLIPPKPRDSQSPERNSYAEESGGGPAPADPEDSIPF